MTDIRKAAEEWLTNYHGSIDATAIIMAHTAGAEWMREQAAQVADSVGHHWSGAGATAAFEVADAIRKIGESDD